MRGLANAASKNIAPSALSARSLANLPASGKFGSLTCTKWCLSLFIFLIGVSAISQPNLMRISGKLVKLEQGRMILETEPGSEYSALIGQDLAALNHGQSFPIPWLLPGDGITAILNAHGKAMMLQTDIRWIAGTVAFAEASRITLLEGQQFFLTGAPVYLNGVPVDPATLETPEQILVRFDAMNKKVVGIWAFQPSAEKPLHISQVNAGLQKGPHGNRLSIQVFAEPKGLLSAEILGVTKHYNLIEKKSGVYRATIPVPSGLDVPQAHLLLRWNSEAWIEPSPITLVTENSEIAQVGPPNGAAVPVNPPFVFISFDKKKPPISAKSTEFFFDRKNVTGVSYLDDYTIFYAPPPLSPGKHQCYVTGKNFRESWSFFVR